MQPEHDTRTTVLLDVDGTLVLSNEAHASAWSDALADAGYDVPAERIVGLVGMGGDRVLPAVTDGLELDDEAGAAITHRRAEIFRERYVTGLQAAPGSRALVERLLDDGYQVVVASSASEEELGSLLDAAGVRDLIAQATTSDDAESSKPAPDIVAAALERAGVPASAAVMIGDTPYDVEAAGRAGVRVIAVRCGGWSDEALAGAVEIHDDPADLLRQYDGSLLARHAVTG